MNEKYFKVLVTQDVTMSTMIPVSAVDPDTAAQIATSYRSLNQFGHLFELNDGSGDKSQAYVGDFDDDIEQINRAQYLDLVGKSDPARNTYTVICLYPDYLAEDYGADIYINTVKADRALVAANMVQNMAAEANLDVIDDPLDFKVIAVTRGELQLEALEFS